MSVSALTSTATSSQLVKLASGEYTAASVTADPKDALRLGLIKESDGNYGTSPSASATVQSSSSVLSAVSSLTLGGK